MARLLWRAWTSLGIGLIAIALNASTGEEDMRRRMTDLLRYTGIENPSPGDVGRMTELWSRAQEPGLQLAERSQAFREMYGLYAKLQAHNLPVSPQRAAALAQFAAATVEGGGRMDLKLPEPRSKPSGTYLHVDTRGYGRTRVLLISDLGIDGRALYDSFIRRQAGTYTMDIVTLPYAGAARPLPWPEQLDYAAGPWLAQIERELLALVDRPRMAGTTIVGTAAGGYFAMRLALLRPKQVRAVVLVNALVNTSLRAATDPDAPATFAERRNVMRAVVPTPQLVPIAPVPPPDELRRLIGDPKSTHPTARNWMAFAVKDDAVSRAWTFDALSSGFLVPSLEYRWELSATDLTESLGQLTVPTLAMGSWPDESSPVANLPTISQWEEMKLRHPAIPLSIATFAATRVYISADAPQEFDRTLAEFLAGRPLSAKPHDSLPRSSPRASVAETVGGTEIAISYGRPAVNARKIWGELVPNGRVWRAGANEATTIAFGDRVQIDGRAIPAGTYTFFVIPRDGDWTLIINRVPRQWGAFDYNPAFDAVRLPATPVSAPHHEYLQYSIQPDGPRSARVTLTWETRAVSFQVDAAK